MYEELNVAGQLQFKTKQTDRKMIRFVVTRGSGLGSGKSGKELNGTNFSYKINKN